MVLPKPYQTQPSAITSYDFTDLITGTAYKTFYGINSSTGYALVPFASDTDAGYEGGGGVGIVTLSTAITDTFTKGVNVNFPITFGIPQIIEGTAVINGTIGTVANTNTAAKNVKLVGQILKNGSHLISGSSAVFLQSDAVNTPFSQEVSVSMDIPKTSFAIGDILSLTCEVWGIRTGGTGTILISLAHDGRDRNDNKAAAYKTIEDTDSTILKCYIPFNPDL